MFDLSLSDEKYSGVIYIGSNPESEIKTYVENGIRNALWVIADPNYIRSLYEKIKFEPIRSQFLNASLAKNDNENLVLNVFNEPRFNTVLNPVGLLEKNKNVKIVSKMPVLTKKFETLYRQNNSEIDLTKFDLIRLDVNGNEFETLQSFGKLLDKFPFKAVLIKTYNENYFENQSKIEDVEKYLLSYGFNKDMTLGNSTFNDILYKKGK